MCMFLFMALASSPVVLLTNTQTVMGMYPLKRIMIMNHHASLLSMCVAKYSDHTKSVAEISRFNLSDGTE